MLSSRILIRPTDSAASRRFYRDILGLAVYREFGDAADPGVVFFLGSGLLEVSGRGSAPEVGNVSIWLQVRDVAAEHQRLSAAGVPIVHAPELQPWGLVEMRIADPDGLPIILVEVPDSHPLRRDGRTSTPL